MYVCICKSVTDKQIRRAVASGADDLYSLRDSLGVASGCGRCADAAQQILDEVDASRCAPSLYVASPG